MGSFPALSGYTPAPPASAPISPSTSVERRSADALERIASTLADIRNLLELSRGIPQAVQPRPPSFFAVPAAGALPCGPSMVGCTCGKVGDAVRACGRCNGPQIRDEIAAL